MADLSQALQDVINERRRQCTDEGYTAEHDDAHADGELARAAAVYALVSALHDEERKSALYVSGLHMFSVVRRIWPARWYNPKIKDRRRDLVRAGALIVAEIERLDRKSHQSAVAK